MNRNSLLMKLLAFFYGDGYDLPDYKSTIYFQTAFMVLFLVPFFVLLLPAHILYLITGDRMFTHFGMRLIFSLLAVLFLLLFMMPLTIMGLSVIASVEIIVSAAFVILSLIALKRLLRANEKPINWK